MNAEKERKAIERLKAFEPEDEPYYLCYSGGKDSDTIRILAQLAGVKHEIWHNHTTVDAPETVRYVRSIPDIKISYPEISMWRLIEKKKVPPTRLMRYCCSGLKERGGQGRVKVIGVRWDESPRRKEQNDVVNVIGKPKANQKKAEEIGAEYRINKAGGLVLSHDNGPARRMVEQCYRNSSVQINPIVDWTTEDVWGFLRHYGCESNPLYQDGFCRIGCVMCPMNPKRARVDAARWPEYRANYVRAFDRMLAARRSAGTPTDEAWRDGEAVMRWWLGEDSRQITFDDWEEMHGA